MEERSSIVTNKLVCCNKKKKQPQRELKDNQYNNDFQIPTSSTWTYQTQTCEFFTEYRCSAFCENNDRPNRDYIHRSRVCPSGSVLLTCTAPLISPRSLSDFRLGLTQLARLQCAAASTQQNREFMRRLTPNYFLFRQKKLTIEKSHFKWECGAKVHFRDWCHSVDSTDPAGLLSPCEHVPTMFPWQPR